MRAVRPTRCTKAAGSCGASCCTIQCTSGMSRPRAATSVQNSAPGRSHKAHGLYQQLEVSMLHQYSKRSLQAPCARPLLFRKVRSLLSPQELYRCLDQRTCPCSFHGSIDTRPTRSAHLQAHRQRRRARPREPPASCGRAARSRRGPLRPAGAPTPSQRSRRRRRSGSTR